MKLLIWAVGMAAVSARVVSKPDLPIVGLGYERHQAISFDEDAGVYNFSNIRYAQPPIGDRRFTPPEPPTGRLPDVQTGYQGRICPQARPEWTLVAAQFVAAFVKGEAQGFDSKAAQKKAEEQMESSGLPAPGADDNPYITEDCLFLDVVVPSAVFGAREGKKGGAKAGGAPVVVWIHGGGYAYGNKAYETSGDPSRLIATSQKDGSPGIIYVSIQYRVGALGWLAGSILEEEGDVSNAGLLDQRLALEWVQKNIHLFGGDPEQVTVMGQSAGGGSIIHHITSYGGWESVPFKRALIMSGGWVPVTSDEQEVNATNVFLDKLNVSTIGDAQDATSDEVILANALVVGAAPWTTFGYGPVVDGTYVSNHASILLANGDYNQDLTIMIGHVQNESPSFTPPFVRTNTQFRDFLYELFPTAEEWSIDYMLETVYLDPGINHTLEAVADIGFTCNVHYLRNAFPDASYNYKWNIPPALHASDVAYLFYNGPEPGDAKGGTRNTPLGPVVVSEAATFQGYVANFVKSGDPNGESLPEFPRADEGMRMLTFGAEGVGVTPDDTDNERCEWLQSVPYGGGCNRWWCF